MNNPLISVIVPIYKVEEYLHRCVDSILAQTYTNLEVILVDDGSPDKCPMICDQYAVEDARVRVIHKLNGGLSSARNAGIDIAKGEYIGFVDSDDYIYPEMYQRLYNDIVTFDVKLAFCQPNMCYNGQTPQDGMTRPTKLMSSNELIPYCLRRNIWFSAWTKLYDRSLFDEIRYPEGLTNEDYPVTIPIFDVCQKVAVNYNPMYNYWVREGSICTSALNVRKFDCIKTSDMVLQYMKDRHPEWNELAEKIYVCNLIGMLQSIYAANDSHKYDQQRADIFSRIRNYGLSIFHNNHLPLSVKFRYLIAFIHPSLYSLICKI